MKKCKKGYYYCNTSEKCKKIPKGHHVMPTGYLMKDDEHKEEETKKNGNGTNGNGNGNGGSNGGSNGGGVSEAWSAKYKKSIDCDNPKGFSQRAHCQGRKKVNEAKEKGDHEIAMAQSQLKKSERNIAKLRKALGTKEKNIPAWVQAKITDTEHNTDAASSYMEENKKDKLKEISKQLAGASKMHAQQSKKVAAVADAIEEAKKCWKGYKKTGTQTLFGKTYNRCVKAGYEVEGEQLDEKLDGKSAKDPGYSLHDWFKGGGWKQAGGKYDGKPCAKQPGQKTKPFCRDADDRAAMSKDERNRRAAKKRAEDPNPDRKGKAKMVTASYSNWRDDLEQLDEIAGALVRAGARHLVKNKALQKTIANSLNRGARMAVGKPAPAKLKFKTLYHGTTKKASDAISKGGWKTDVGVTAQRRGPGVYATPEKKSAMRYALGKVEQQGGKPDLRQFRMRKDVYNDVMRRQAADPNDWVHQSGVPQVTMKPEYANKIDVSHQFKPTLDLSGSDFTGNMKKELMQKIKSGLRKPQNREQLKSDLKKGQEASKLYQHNNSYSNWRDDLEQLDEGLFGAALKVGSKLLKVAKPAIKSAAKVAKPGVKSATTVAKPGVKSAATVAKPGVKSTTTAVAKQRTGPPSPGSDPNFVPPKQTDAGWSRPGAAEDRVRERAARLGKERQLKTTLKQDINKDPWSKGAITAGDRRRVTTDLQDVDDLKLPDLKMMQNPSKRLRPGESYSDYAKRQGMTTRKEEVEIHEEGGKKDACYHKVKSRYKVWPSAYASGALVKCRKKGAANWGNKTEGYEYSNWRDDYQPIEIETTDLITTDEVIQEKMTDAQMDKRERIVKSMKKNFAGFKKRYGDDAKSVMYATATKQALNSHYDWRFELELQEKKKSKPDYLDFDKDGDKKEPMKKALREKEKVQEDWQKVNRKDKTDGLSQKAVDAYRRENPGSKLQTAVTEKNPSGKRAQRRKNFCRRMKGMKNRLTSAETARDPDSRINKALRRWNCN